MCGISGIIAPNAIRFEDAVGEMNQKLRHRGPDADKVEIFENAVLGHRRLSIIDLSSNADQPMFSTDREQAIVLNGEIYGYKTLKEKYNKYRYKNTSDTELILAMYKDKEENLLDELPGMFAFALWDDEKQKLFCARDRFGEKPFYYAIGDEGEFIFASELKAILATKLLQPKVNSEALFHYLKYGYVSTYQTIFTNVHALPPAHYLTFQNDEIKINRYWRMPTQDSTYSLEQAIEPFNQLMNEAINKQLVADVPVGCFLSGGLDSSTIVAKASQLNPNIKTLSFGFENHFSELPYAKSIAEKYHTDHIEVLEKEYDKVQKLKEVTPFFDEPFCDMSFMPTYEICRIASKNLKVMLSGDVGDELFGGYHFYRVESEMKSHQLYKKTQLKRMLKWAQKFRSISFVAEKNLEHESIYDFHQNHVRNFFTEDEIQNLGINAKYAQTFSFTINPDSLNDIMRVDLEKFVPGNMMVKSDRMAMANSLEVRTPFLDVDFASFCIQLPENLKVNSKEDKIILREACSELWTDDVRNRSKRGFGRKLEPWFKEDPNLAIYSNEILSDKNNKMYNYLNFDEVQKCKKGDIQEWSLLQLALWFNNYSEYL